jgi:carbon storage regulator
MLVLSRKTGERINIGDDIVVEVRRVAGNRVTLAVEAPRSVRILRGELLQPAREFEGEGSEAQSEPVSPSAEPYIVSHERYAAVSNEPQTL